MKYEFEVLAALVQFKHVNTKVIVNSTGISERKVQSVLKDLHSNLGICIKKRREKNSFYFFIESWGVFETGSSIIERLYKLDLAKAKAAESHQKIRGNANYYHYLIKLNIQTQLNSKTIMKVFVWREYHLKNLI